MARQLWWVVAGVVALLASTGAQRVPPSPCPSIFHYQIGSTGSWQGVLHMPPPGPRDPLKVKIVMDIGVALPSNYVGKLDMVEDINDVAQGIREGTQREVQYRVLFPLQNQLPIMRKVSANGNIICSGPKMDAPWVTTISLEHTFYPPLGPQSGLNYEYQQQPARPTFEVSQPSKPVEFEGFETVFQTLPSARLRPSGPTNPALVPSTGAQEVPASPCPSIFHYEVSSPGSWQGILHVPVPEPTSSFTVVIKMVLKARLPTKYYGKLELIGNTNDVARGIMRGTQREVHYRVLFPLRNPLPIMRSVVANGKVICSGPEVEAPYLTSISLEYTVFSYGVPPTGTGGFIQPQEPTLPNFEVMQRPGGFEVIETVPQMLPLPRPRPTNVPPITRPTNVPPVTRPTYQPPITRPTYVPPITRPTNVPPITRPTNVPPITRPTDPPPTSSTDYDQCGRATQVSELVAKGKVSRPGEWPWLGALYHYNNEGGTDYACSSTLINDMHIVTAAHCLWKDEEELLPNEVVVFLGKYNLYSQTEPHSQAMEIKAVHVHNDYAPDNLMADIAVLKFKRRVIFSLFIRPICLWNRSPDINPWIDRLGTVVGWGRDEKGNNNTPEPRMVQVPIVSYEKCINSRDDFFYFTNNRTFCAGARDGSGPCNGDSGGGFVLPMGDSWYLRGIVSLSLKAKGTLTCDLNEYIIYTDVAKFKDWLQPYMIR